MPGSEWWSDQTPPLQHSQDASEEQLDLFSWRGVPSAREPAATYEQRAAPAGELGDVELIAALPMAGVVDAPLLAVEAGRRGLIAAVPALEELCRRFAGFGVDRAIPEQVAALEALAMIDGRDAARAVARVIDKGAVQGPALKIAMAAAAQLGADLPARAVLRFLRHEDPAVRAGACRCVRGWPDSVPILVELLDEPAREVRRAAACALGRLGWRPALHVLGELLKTAPSPEVIEALTPIADDDCVIILARLARTRPDLADAAREALEAIDHPRAQQVLTGLAQRGQG